MLAFLSILFIHKELYLKNEVLASKYAKDLNWDKIIAWFMPTILNHLCIQCIRYVIYSLESALSLTNYVGKKQSPTSS